MDQKLEGTPSVEIKLEGRTVVRSEVQNNWGTRLQWRLLKEGKEIATGSLGPDPAFDLPELQQGSYQVAVSLCELQEDAGRKVHGKQVRGHLQTVGFFGLNIQ
jgi:hypothetical protein